MKKVISGIAALLIAAAAIFSCSATELATTTRGDANGDDVVNINDVTEIQRHIAQMIEITGKKKTLAADVDNDGKITIQDATLIQMYLADYVDRYDVGGKILYDPFQLPFVPAT